MREKDGDCLFDITDRGYNGKAWYLKDTETRKGEAYIEITKGGWVERSFVIPACKVYNIAAHFSDIVDSEIEQNMTGYEEALSPL